MVVKEYSFLFRVQTNLRLRFYNNNREKAEGYRCKLFSHLQEIILTVKHTPWHQEQCNSANLNSLQEEWTHAIESDVDKSQDLWTT